MLFFLQDKLSAILKIVKDAIFPIFCLSCQTEGHWLCPDCLENLKKEIKPQFFCPHCYNNNQDGWTCQACRPFSFLDRTMSLASYENKTIAQMIQLLKYDYIEEMAEVFERLIDNSEFGVQHSSFNIHHSTFIILPVPLHRRRYLERGFNQAELIAKVWAKHLGLATLSDVLVRGRPTKTQVGLGREDRRQNLLGAFKLKKPLPTGQAGLLSEKVILIDDVFTTGSTLQECARVLKEGGAEEVWGVTLARET